LWSTEVFQEHNGIWLRCNELSCAGGPMKVESVKQTDLALRLADGSQLKREPCYWCQNFVQAVDDPVQPDVVR
ncbi:hypothetical protein KUCAC02_003789, partial [Chaenocephalus aceratus]